MKISITASVLILAAGAVLGWHDRQQLAALRTTQKRLAAEAATLGISPDAALHPTRSAKRSIRVASAKLSTAELIEIAGKYHELPLLDSLSAMDPVDLKALLAEAATNPDLDERARILLRHSCSTVLANDHPRAALEIFTSSPELFTAGDRGRSLFLTALACLAKEDLTAALDWLRKNPQQYAAQAKGEIIAAVAEQDSQLAFRLVTELGLGGSNQAIGPIVDAAKTLEQKSAALAGLREYLATIQDEKIRGRVAEISIGGLSRHVEREGFESATRWISEMKFTAREFDQFIDRMNFPTTNGETGRWIEWLRESPPAEGTEQRIDNLIRQWVTTDYQAAAQWAMTRPPGKDRDETFKNIYSYWPEDDSAAREAFAKEHGIK